MSVAAGVFFSCDHGNLRVPPQMLPMAGNKAFVGNYSGTLMVNNIIAPEGVGFFGVLGG